MTDVIVTQEDRVLFRDLLGLDVTSDTNRILSGVFDAHPKMIAIASHRIKAALAMQERAAIAARDSMVAHEWPPQDGDVQIDEVMDAIRNLEVPG